MSTHQRDDEALRQLQQVAPQDGTLHLRRPLPLDSLCAHTHTFYFLWAESSAHSLPSVPHAAHLQQPFDQNLVLVQEGPVGRVDACRQEVGVRTRPPAPSGCRLKDNISSPGLVSIVFSLDSFFTFTCLGRSPAREADITSCAVGDFTSCAAPFCGWC